MKMDRQDTLTRREFLAGAGGFATGAAVGAVLGGGILDLVPAKAAAKDTPTWPWPYVQLDPEVARRQAYELYFDGG